MKSHFKQNCQKMKCHEILVFDKKATTVEALLATTLVSDQLWLLPALRKPLNSHLNSVLKLS